MLTPPSPRRGELTITVELSELGLFDGALLTSLQKSPEDQLDLFEAAASDVLRKAVLGSTPCSPQCRKLMGVSLFIYFIYLGDRSIEVQIALKSTQLATPLRLLAADHVGKLIKVSGIIVSAHALWNVNPVWSNNQTRPLFIGASKVKSKAARIEIQ